MTISVIIPTVNEDAIISERIYFIREHGGSTVVEIIVCDGDSDDETVMRAEKAGARIIRCAERNRALQMNAGAEHAKADVLYFVHADTQLNSSFVTDISGALTNGFVSGCYRYVFDSEKLMLKVNAWFTRFDLMFCRGGDQTLFVKKEVFRALNGFNESFVIMEDYEFLKRVQQQASFLIIPKYVIVSSRKYNDNSWLRVQFSNLVAFSMYRFKMSPKKIKIAYKKMLNYRHDGICN
ncbi:glycosyl transferase [Chryseotalea sanaruensis]|uniref:Glycosyl transferase n=1 Tax=Chryseotalea sanaruensis TaxID=2482724 RepID=A0A401U5L9_9BACT|nr:TIGR04283 family arsenosugar biosynthesis glycosyltransferase [Chryseotalea sanaruensis]GCC50187.1 glycosyl transferase [Chryseotalea sanaruensis]